MPSAVGHHDGIIHSPASVRFKNTEAAREFPTLEVAAHQCAIKLSVPHTPGDTAALGLLQGTVKIGRDRPRVSEMPLTAPHPRRSLEHSGAWRATISAPAV